MDSKTIISRDKIITYFESEEGCDKTVGRLEVAVTSYFLGVVKIFHPFYEVHYETQLEGVVQDNIVIFQYVLNKRYIKWYKVV